MDNYSIKDIRGFNEGGKETMKKLIFIFCLGIILGFLIKPIVSVYRNTWENDTGQIRIDNAFGNGFILLVAKGDDKEDKVYIPFHFLRRLSEFAEHLDDNGKIKEFKAEKRRRR